MVYDPEQRESNSLLAPAESWNSGQANADEAQNEGSASNSTNPILVKEREAAKGSSNLGGGAAGAVANKATDAAKSAVTNAATKAGLAAAESAVPAAAAAGAAAAALNTLTKGLTTAEGKKISRGRAGIAVALILIVGGTGTTFLAHISGPLKLIHSGALLEQLFTDPHTGQSESRALKVYRTLRAHAQGKPQRSHMGMVGNLVADRIDAKLKAGGIESLYSSSSGAFEGYKIDPGKIPGLAGLSQDEAIKKLGEKPYNIKSEITKNADGTLKLEGRNLGWMAERRLGKTAMKLGGFGRFNGAAAARIYGARNLVGWHPIKKRVNNFADAKAEDGGRAGRFKDWAKEKATYFKEGTKAIVPAEGIRGEKKPSAEKINPDAPAAGDAAQEIQQQAADAVKDPSKLAAFSKDLTIKVTTGIGLAGLVCFVNYVANHFDEIYQNTIEVPMMRMSSDLKAVAGAVKDGYTADGQLQLEQVEFEVERTYGGPKGKETDFLDNQPAQAALGEPLSGVDVPAEAKPDPKGNILTQILGKFPDLEDICKVADNPLVAIGAVVVYSAVTKSVPVAALLTGFVGAYIAKSGAEVLARSLAGQVVDMDSVGGLRGAFTFFGGGLEGRAIALPTGALPVPQSQTDSQRDSELALQDEDFMQENLAYRLFNPVDRRSLVAQVLDQQSSNPASNVARAGLNLLNIGKTFGTIATIPFSKSVAAASTYNWGYYGYSYTDAEMEDERYADSAGNDKKVAGYVDEGGKAVQGLLDKKPEYVERAKKCFKVNIAKETVENPQTKKQEEQWTLLPPETAPDPLQRDLLNPENKCLPITEQTKKDFPNEELIQDADEWSDADVEEWTRVRFWIYDTTIMNTYGCYEADGKEPVLDKTCIDIGLEKNPNPPAGTAAAGSTTGGAIPGGIGLNNWYLTLPVGKSGEPDLISCEDIKKGVTKDPWYIRSGAGYLFKVDTSDPNKATTPNSKNYRSEYREMANDCKDKASWSSSSGRHEMTVTTNVKSVQGADAVVVAQIHDAEDDTAVFRVEGSNLHITNGDDSKWKVLQNAITPGTPFTVQFVVENNVIKFFLNGKEVASQPHTFSGAYFKAGNYLQGSGSAEVEITALQVKHSGVVTSGGTPTGTSGNPSAGPRAVPATEDSLSPDGTTDTQSALDGLNGPTT